jgi:hypothetical protein
MVKYQIIYFIFSSVSLVFVIVKEDAFVDGVVKWLVGICMKVLRWIRWIGLELGVGLWQCFYKYRKYLWGGCISRLKNLWRVVRDFWEKFFIVTNSNTVERDVRNF